MSKPTIKEETITTIEDNHHTILYSSHDVLMQIKSLNSTDSMWMLKSQAKELIALLELVDDDIKHVKTPIVGKVTSLEQRRKDAPTVTREVGTL